MGSSGRTRIGFDFELTTCGTFNYYLGLSIIVSRNTHCDRIARCTTRSFVTASSYALYFVSRMGAEFPHFPFSRFDQATIIFDPSFNFSSLVYCTKIQTPYLRKFSSF